MWDLIKREPARFANIAHAFFILLGAIISVLLPEAMDPAAKAAIVGGISGLGLSFTSLLRDSVVPVVKLSEATIERAADMSKSDIAKVAEVKADAARVSP